MGDLLSSDKIAILLRFVVPGLIIVYVRNQFVSNRPPAIGEAAVAYIALSFVYQALVFWIPSKLDTSALPTGWAAVEWVLRLFVAPAIVGMLLGLDARRGWTRFLLAKMGVTVSHPVDCAWDWRFGECEECWILAVLKDGTQWAGHLGAGSFMSTDRSERDLFLDSVYKIGDDDRWSPKGSGVWIAHGEIQTIEFWPMRKE